MIYVDWLTHYAAFRCVLFELLCIILQLHLRVDPLFILW